jgi:single-stranded-DNA-specific exonuclease
VSTWLEPPAVEPSDALVGVAGHPLLAQILQRRGFNTPAAARAFLNPDAYAPTPPSALPDASVAADRLREAIDSGKRILVWGDFDVDGQTATSLLVSVIQRSGGHVRSYIPHRIREGHGIKPESLKAQLAGIDLLLTCDTGVDEHQAIAYARDRAITVIITDHHDLPPELPAADAIVDPKRLPLGHALRELPGVGVAYKLAQELYRLTGQPVEQAEQELDLVALGIVADVATQRDDTRYLLQRGLPRLRATRRVGLGALMSVAQLNPARLTTDHIGFSLGPRLNALGRLGDANLGVELLTTGDVTRAHILANQLEGLNSRRRLMTQQIYAAAQEQIAQQPSLLDYQALVLSGPRWHPGIIGIVASRLAEMYGSPTILISEGEDGHAKGSARSVPGVDIHAAITAVEPLLTSHGGHPGAAGLSLPNDHIAQFRRALSRAVGEIWDRSVSPGLAIDAELEWGELSLDLVQDLDALAPFGEGNPHIVLATQRLEAVSCSVFGRDRAHRRLSVRTADGTTREVIWWRGAEHAPPAGPFDLAYRLKASDYQGTASLQIEYVDARAVAAPPAVEVTPKIQVVDYRSALDPYRVLERLRSSESVVVWAEGYAPDRSPGIRRDQLETHARLVVWTPPPGPREWQATLERVAPEAVYLLAVSGAGTDPRHFMARLAGLVKYTLRRREGVADLEQLAAASAQRIETVRQGVLLLGARGDVQVIAQDDMVFQLAPGKTQTAAGTRAIETRLRALLQETAAYRAFFARADPERLIDAYRRDERKEQNGIPSTTSRP